MQHDEAYSGIDNLEVMAEAVNYNRCLLEMVRRYAPNSGRVLDFGAGAGQFAGPLAALGLDVTALEPDDTLRSRLIERGINAAAALGDLADGSLAYIYTLNVLEHIHDHAGTLRQLYQKLNPGGTLLIYVPAFPALYTSMDLKVGHVRRYKREALTEVAVAAGFEIREARYMDSLGFFATLLFKWIGSEDGSVNRAALKAYDRLVFPVSRAVDGVAQRWFGKNLLLVAGRA